jgi:hypothetical protein
MNHHKVQRTVGGIIFGALLAASALANLHSAAVTQTAKPANSMPALNQVRPMLLVLPTMPFETPADARLRQQGCVDLIVRTSLPAKCRGADGQWIKLGQGEWSLPTQPAMTPVP